MVLSIERPFRGEAFDASGVAVVLDVFWSRIESIAEDTGDSICGWVDVYAPARSAGPAFEWDVLRLFMPLPVVFSGE